MSVGYFYIFLQSNLLEVPFYYLFFYKYEKFVKVLCFASAINSLTHPIVFFLIMNMKLSYINNILIAESFAVIIEGFFFNKLLGYSKMNSFVGALVANLVSWQFAPMLTYLILR